VSEPVKTDFGWHLIKFHGTKKENGQTKYHASHILLRLKPSSESLAKIKATAEEFASQSQKVGFEKLAGQKDLDVLGTGLFKKNDFLKDFGSNSPAHQFAFEAKVGAISTVIETPSGYAVCKVAEQKPAGIKSLEEMENFLAKELNGQKALVLAFQKATQIYLTMKPGQTLSQLAQENQLKLSHTGTFTVQDISVSGVGISPEFQGVAFSLTKENPRSKPVRGKFGAYIIELASKEAPSDSVFAAMQDSLTSELLNERQSETYNQWLSDLKRQAKIEDFRQQAALVDEENL
ncbi:MAG: peptidylprolyl isomerase, partial [candidate division Zixibacteria bacterium]|nr:peptidylprolyl isomerase [candidate division Zixibacteria bacterium]